MGNIELEEEWRDRTTMQEDIAEYIKRKAIKLDTEEEKRVCEKLIEKIFEMIDGELQGVISEVESEMMDEI